MAWIATVVDANGNTVSDFNGTVNLSIPTAGGTLTNSSVTITNGVGTDTLTTPSTAPSGAQTVSVAGLATTNGSAMATNVTYESTSITETTPTATQLAVSIASGSPSSIGTNTAGEYTDVTVALEDAAGNTWSNESGQYVTLTLTGPGSFSSTSTQTTLTTFVTGTSLAIPVYSQVGTPGTVTITASGSAVSSETLNIPTYNNTAPASLNVQTLNGKDSNGNAYTQYTVSLLATITMPPYPKVMASLPATKRRHFSSRNGKICSNFWRNRSSMSWVYMESSPHDLIEDNSTPNAYFPLHK